MTVHLPSNLYRYTGDRRSVEADGSTLAEVLDDLDRRYPGLRFRIVDEQGAIRPHIRMFVGARPAADLKARVGPQDEVHVMAALSGG